MKEYLRTDGASLNILYTAPANTVSIVYSVYDLDNNQYIQQDQTNTVVSNIFTLTLNSDTTAYDRKLKIEIQGIKTNDSFTDELYISLVRPYATAKEIAEYAGINLLPDITIGDYDLYWGNGFLNSNEVFPEYTFDSPKKYISLNNYGTDPYTGSYIVGDKVLISHISIPDDSTINYAVGTITHIEKDYSITVKITDFGTNFSGSSWKFSFISHQAEDSNNLNQSTIEKFEKKARLLINSRTNDNFYFEYKTVPTLGIGTDLLHLGERIESYDKVTSDDVVLYDSSLYETIDDLSLPLIISESHYGLRTYQESVNISEWKDINPIYTQRFFAEGSSFNIRGEYGWKNVPDAIKQATMELFIDLICSDFVYRNKGFKSIKNDSFDITFQDGILNSTGNLYVDALLEPYKRWDLRAI